MANWLTQAGAKLESSGLPAVPPELVALADGVVESVLEERTLETMQPLVDTIFSLVTQVHQFCSDEFPTYSQLVCLQGRCKARHDVAPREEQIYTVESTNASTLLYVRSGSKKSLFSPADLGD